MFALGALEAQRLFEHLLYRVGPAAGGAGVVFTRSGRIGSAAVVFTVMVAAEAGLIARRYPLHLMPVSRVVARALAPAVGLILAGLLFLAAGAPLEPAWLVAAVMVSWPIVALGVWLETRFDAERPVRLAVLGSAALAGRLSEELSGAGVRSHRVVGFIPLEPADADFASGALCPPRLGDPSALRRLVGEHDLELLVLAASGPQSDVVGRTAVDCLGLPVRVIEASAFYEETLGHVPIGKIGLAWFQYLVHPRFRRRSPAAKRLVDLAVGIPLGLVALPVVWLAALAIMLEDRGPAVYRQRRVGEGGREFDMLKLRTMRMDAESSGNPVWHVSGDPRVTRVGRILRRIHIDELPQLVNVIRGEMTLVGPRPERPRFVDELATLVPHYERRHLVRPGLTGWAQVRCGYGGSRTGSAWKVCHDLYHLKHGSLLFDLLVLVETVPAALVLSDSSPRLPAEDFLLGTGDVVAAESPQPVG